MTSLQGVKQFRERLYHKLPRRRDATMNLIDALASRTAARSPVELSLEPAFRRGHNSLYDAVDTFFTPTSPRREHMERRGLEAALRREVAALLGPPAERPFWLLGLDVVPVSRPHAVRLYDRSYVHQPTVVPGQVPVTIGHNYSQLVSLPEKAPGDAAWTVPLSTRRVVSPQTAGETGVMQVDALLDDAGLPWHEQLVALVMDSGYGNAPCLSPLLAKWADRLVPIVRLRSDRVLYRVPPPRPPGKRGRPRRYGARFDLGGLRTHGEPAAVWIATDPKGCRVRVSVWHDLLIRGTGQHPMHRHPCTLLRIERLDAEGRPLWRRPMWLGVFGDRRDEISPACAEQAYRQRFDQEHGHRFQKQRLLLAGYQTCETEHEENWVTLVGLAYALLFAARHLAGHLPRPWERRPRPEGATSASPAMVQRDFGRILAELGTPALPTKPRGKSQGRPKGHSPGRRMRRPVLKSAQFRPKRARSPARKSA